MMTRITLAIALAVATLATVPASAGPDDDRYPKGYQDSAYNKNGW
jgi:hypothetical protein